MSGTRGGAGASLLRGMLRAAEPLYAGTTLARNKLFDVGLRKTHQLPRPLISVGNITTGGTGKTPMVRWLATRLREQGSRIAILSRGYKSAAGALGDEQLMLDRLLNAPGLPAIVIKSNPSRVESASEVMRENPQIDLFVLDDGFQHRAVARDLDIVLLNAAEPFGFDHVLPRGLLREPLRGLKRAGAIVITHCEQMQAAAVDRIEAIVRRHSSAPIYRAAHVSIGLRSASTASSAPPEYQLDELRGNPFLAFAGIGNPQSFDLQLRALGSNYVGYRWFADHHAYTAADVDSLLAASKSAGAQVLVTTEKDWAKLAKLPRATGSSPPIWRLDVAIQFEYDDESRLLHQINSVLAQRAKKGCTAEG